MFQYSRAQAIANVTAAVRRCEALARQKYPMMFGVQALNVEFFERGTRAGEAEYGKHTVRFNLAMAMQNDATANLTVPHEVAHIVARLVYGDKGGGHGAYWRSVCLALGGDGRRCYSAEARGVTVIKARRTTHHLYRDSLGNEVWVGPVHHGKMQRRPTSYAIRTIATGARITAADYLRKTKVS